MKHPEYLVDIAENMEKVRDGGQALAIRNSGVNLFDISKVKTTQNAIINNGDGSLSILAYGTTCSSPNRLKNYCPMLKVGDIVSLSGKSTAMLTVGTYTESMARFDLYEASVVWRFGETKTVTQAMLDSQVIWFCSKTDNVISNATVSNIQLELVSTPITDTLTNRGHRLMPEMNEILSNMNDIYQAGQESAAALKTSVRGAAISVNDVHKVEHNVGVQLRSKNLLNAFDIKNSGGYNAFDTFEQSEGCVTVTSDNSTVRIVSFNLLNKYLQKGNYILSFDIECENSVTTSGNCDCIYIWHNDVFETARSLKNDGQNGSIVYKFTLTETTHVEISWYKSVMDYVTNNTIYKAILSNIQLEIGTTATAYTPYVSDFADVNSCRNLLNPDYFTGTQIINGITFTDNGDGSITLNGTATSEAIYGCIGSTNPLPLNASTYTLSGGLDSNVWIQGKVVEDDTLAFYNYGTAVKFTLNNDYNFRFNIRVSAGTVCENVIIKPQLELGTAATSYEPYREPVAAEVSRYGKNLFDIDTVLPSFINNYGEAFKWEKQSDGSYYKGNVGTGYGDVWFENKANYKGQIAISIASKHTITEVGGFGLTLELEYTDGTKKTVIYTPMLSETYSVKTFVTDANKTVFRITQSYNSGKGMYVKDIMIAYGTDTTYEPYIKPATYTAKADGTVERLKYGKNLALAEDVYKGNYKYAIVEFEGRKAVRFIDSEDALWNGISFKPNTQYTVSFDARLAEWNSTTTELSELFCFMYSDGQMSWITSKRNTEWEHFTLTSKAGKTVVAVGIVSYNYRNMNYIDCDSFQLEEGSTATPYEPYQEPVIEGVKSISPNMTLLSNTSGVIIDAEYFRQQ